jgi:hypothetical protein
MPTRVKRERKGKARPLQVRLAGDFVKAVQHYAIDADKSVTQVVQEALQEYLAVRRKPRPRASGD